MQSHVAAGEVHRMGIHVRQVHPRLGEGYGGRDADAAAAAAQIQHRAGILREPGSQPPAQQGADGRARDHHPRLDEELETGEAPAAEQVGRWNAIVDPAARQRRQLRKLLRREGTLQHRTVVG